MARLDWPICSTPMRFGVIADPHLATKTTGTWKCFHRTESYLQRAVEGVQKANPEGVIVAGDLTKDGEPHNVDRYDELIAPVQDPITIPGNHDVPKEFTDHTAMSLESFADRYTDSGYPFRRSVGDVDLLCVNSATMPDGSLRETWGGRLSQHQLNWLNRELESTAIPVVVIHHNLFAQPEHDDEFGGNFRLANRHQLLDLLAAHAPVLVISGHHHIPSIHSERGITEIISPAICSYPPSYLLVDIDSTGTTITRVPVATPAEQTENYTLGVVGTELGQRIVEIAVDRVEKEPMS